MTRIDCTGGEQGGKKKAEWLAPRCGAGRSDVCGYSRPAAVPNRYADAPGGVAAQSSVLAAPKPMLALERRRPLAALPTNRSPL